MLALAAGAWLTAGPGGVALQAMLCSAHNAHHAGHEHGHQSAPAPSTPCFCDQMTGHSDQLLPPAMAPLIRIVVASGRVEARLPFPSSPAPPVDFSPTPLSPPPDAAA